MVEDYAGKKLERISIDNDRSRKATDLQAASATRPMTIVSPPLRRQGGSIRAVRREAGRTNALPAMARGAIESAQRRSDEDFKTVDPGLGHPAGGSHD